MRHAKTTAPFKGAVVAAVLVVMGLLVIYGLQSAKHAQQTPEQRFLEQVIDLDFDLTDAEMLAVGYATCDLARSHGYDEVVSVAYEAAPSVAEIHRNMRLVDASVNAFCPEMSPTYSKPRSEGFGGVESPRD